MGNPLTDFSQATPQWLTERLHANGYLQGGEATRVSVNPSRSQAVVRLEVEYSGKSDNLPTSFFLKTGDSDECVDRDVLLHRDMISLMEISPSAQCFDTAYDPETTKAHILTEDLSQTHYHGTWGISTSLKEESEAIVDLLSRFHAYWWDHPSLNTEFGEFPAEDNILFFHGIENYQKALASVIDTVGDRISSEQRIIYERALRSYPFLDLQNEKRLKPGNRLTVIHGDVLPDNILLPKDLSIHPIYLIDWAFWEVRVGTDDVANIGLFGFCDPNADMTKDLVQRYYNGLLHYGVSDYSWADCWHDYRLSTIRNLFIPLNSFRDSGYSWNNLNRSIQSFYDLDCMDLLDK
ncbi:MAG: hypothetical protein GKR89_20060 [Candidatus Latescibacteria bacterium]|nr:hypothetical protein [Candidatus Latescibacterota bacterium]